MSAAADLYRLVAELGQKVEQRVAIVEVEQDNHEHAVEARLQRYEQTQAAQTDRVIEAVRGLAKLEAVPDAIREIRAEQRAEIARIEAKVDKHTLDIEDLKAAGAHQNATAAGRRSMADDITKAFTWFLEHGWKIVVSAWGLIWVWTLFSQGRLPMQQPATPLPAQARVYEQPEQVIVIPPQQAQPLVDPPSLRGSQP